ncbi:MAG: preprotein translocase subunit SecA [Bacteroidetes bacterium 4572_77]|nr:MAG: preprotein translocase subunit SecA [Bacteroidetes bacterium 4572_77]
MSLLTKVFGTKHDKDIKKIKPIVEEINRYDEEYAALSEEDLKGKTNEFRKYIIEETQDLEAERAKCHDILVNEALSAGEIADMAEKIKKLDKDIFATTQDILNEILPQAFAVVKQTCKRLAEEKFTYEYAGQGYTWDMVPYDVQLIGGIVIHQGKISEMQTGEGKTLVAVAPVYLNALPAKGVHLVTVNDYLAKRDCDWMRPVYEYLGLTCDAMQGKMDNVQRRRIYDMDISYGTNNEFGFDYLRDNMVIDKEHKVQRPHWFAIVDEVDSVLIDEARTPLIISGPVPQTDQRFEEMNPRVRGLVQAQTSLVNTIIKDVLPLLESKDKEDREKAGIGLLRASRALPKHKRLMKILQEPEHQKLRTETELFYLGEKGKRMHEVDDELFYVVEEKHHSIDLTEKGRDHITSGQDDPDLFLLPDIAAELSSIEGDEEMPHSEKQRKKDETYRIYAERSDRLHTLQQLLKAYTLFEKDVEYVIQENKVMIVDEFTGRVMDGRRYSDGLHQAIEAKESVKVERDTQTMATITLQNYFRLYHKLSGMTGTAETEAAEFEKIYELDCVVIPTNRPMVRDDQEDLIYKTTREKYNAIIDMAIELLAEGRPILVGTASVDVSEILSKLFTRKKVKHNVLNAKNHAREAEIVANAGKKGSLTIATNMAGRGTDIKLSQEVKEAGGLAILGSERHDARRIDRQLRGRAGRQGDPGSSIFFISLEDKLMRLFGGERVANVMSSMKIPEGEPIQHKLISNTVEKAQKKIEENNFGTRKRLIEYDDVMNQQRNVIYTRRNAALRGDRLKGELFEYVEDLSVIWYEEYLESENYEGFINQIRTKLMLNIEISEKEFYDTSQEDIMDKIKNTADQYYVQKEEVCGITFLSQLETVAVLQTIDDKWKEHLRAMDDMKEGIHLRSYGQKDPLLEYKKEAFSMFKELIMDINMGAVSYAFRYWPQVVKQNADGSHSIQVAPVAPTLNRKSPSRDQFTQSSTLPSFLQGSNATGGAPQMKGPEGKDASSVSKTIRRTAKKINRNDMVKVRYSDGRIIEAKYKKVEKELNGGTCELVE